MLLGIAALASLAGLWILAPTLLAGERSSGSRAAVAARIGLFRSDIWARAAITVDAQKSASGNRGTNDPAMAAVSLSPLRSEQWIEIAGSQSTPQDAAVTMALFTGPGRRDLVDRRLDAAGRVAGLEKTDLCEMLRSDIRYKLGQQPAVAGLASLPPAGMECFKRLAAEVIPQ